MTDTQSRAARAWDASVVVDAAPTTTTLGLPGVGGTAVGAAAAAASAATASAAGARQTARRGSSNKRKRRGRPHKQAPGYGFFYGSCTAGLSGGAINRRACAWERFNNDRHLRKNISSMKSTFTTQPKVSWKVKLRRRNKILQRVKDVPDPVSRAMKATNEVQQQLGAILASGSKNKLESRIRTAVNAAVVRWSVPREHVSRLWMEVVIPETVPGGGTLVRFKQFGHVLRRLCRGHKPSQELLAAYLERRCVSDDNMAPDQVGALWKQALSCGALHEDTIFAWFAGMLGAVRIVAVVDMTPSRREKLRGKIKPFMDWLGSRQTQEAGEVGVTAAVTAAVAAKAEVGAATQLAGLGETIPPLNLGSLMQAKEGSAVSEGDARVEAEGNKPATQRARPKPPLKPKAPKPDGGRAAKNVVPKSSRS